MKKLFLILLATSTLVAMNPAQINNRLMRWYLAVDSRPTEPEFTFTRLRYSGGIEDWKFWGTDFPAADKNLMESVRRITLIRTDAEVNAMDISEKIYRYPFVYLVEPAQVVFSEPEVEILREYLLRGGFLIADDFWGREQWAIFEKQFSRILPEYPIVEIPTTHPIFHTFYDIEEVPQIPAFGGTYEEDGRIPHLRGIFNDAGDLMAVINWNTDLGDGWEWVGKDTAYSEQSSIPALKMGVNIIIYAMTH